MKGTFHGALVKKDRLSNQISSLLKESILSGEFINGDRLPTESQLAEDLKVSKVTVLVAVYEMEAEVII